jgi:hypothetical protein
MRAPRLNRGARSTAVGGDFREMTAGRSVQGLLLDDLVIRAFCRGRRTLIRESDSSDYKWRCRWRHDFITKPPYEVLNGIFNVQFPHFS